LQYLGTIYGFIIIFSFGGGGGRCALSFTTHEVIIDENNIIATSDFTTCLKLVSMSNIFMR